MITHVSRGRAGLWAGIVLACIIPVALPSLAPAESERNHTADADAGASFIPMQSTDAGTSCRVTDAGEVEIIKGDGSVRKETNLTYCSSFTRYRWLCLNGTLVSALDDCSNTSFCRGSAECVPLLAAACERAGGCGTTDTYVEGRKTGLKKSFLRLFRYTKTPPSQTALPIRVHLVW